jgi:hypothetical protein
MEVEGKPLSFLLDIVEVVRSHSGFNMAETFARILREFGVEDKVRRSQGLLKHDGLIRWD